MLEPREYSLLSDNQRLFCRAAVRAGLQIDYTYSGRGMFGKMCPAVRVDRLSDFRTKAKVQTDSMGMGVVIYAQF